MKLKKCAKGNSITRNYKHEPKLYLKLAEKLGVRATFTLLHLVYKTG